MIFLQDVYYLPSWRYGQLGRTASPNKFSASRRDAPLWDAGKMQDLKMFLIGIPRTGDKRFYIA